MLYPARQEPVPLSKSYKPWARLPVDLAGPIHIWAYPIIVNPNSKWPDAISLRQTAAIGQGFLSAWNTRDPCV